VRDVIDYFFCTLESRIKVSGESPQDALVGAVEDTAYVFGWTAREEPIEAGSLVCRMDWID
jgi:hypothetical protein